MLGLARQGCNADFFDAHEDIDDGTLTDIWVANCTYYKTFVIFIFALGSRLSLEPGEELGSRENFARAQLELAVQCRIKCFLMPLCFLFISGLPL